MARDSPSLSPVDSPVNRCESSSALRAQAPGGRSGRELGSRGRWPPALSLACPSSLPPGPRLRSALPAVLCTCLTAPRPGAPRTGPSTSCWGPCAGPNSTSRSGVEDVLLPLSDRAEAPQLSFPQQVWVSLRGAASGGQETEAICLETNAWPASGAGARDPCRSQAGWATPNN